MSEMIVKVQRVTQIEDHPNADRLDVIHIDSWSTCFKKDALAMGELVVFIPPDAILPESLHSFLNITQYCGEMPKSSKENEQGKRRVRATRLRGVKSFGTIVTLDQAAKYLCHEAGCNCSYYEFMQLAVEDFDVADILYITKYTPPEKTVSGDMAPDNAMFHKYTDIQNYKNYPNVIQNDEVVILLEKLHGTNNRVGLVTTDEGQVWMAGSHRTRRKEFDTKENQSLYWSPLNSESMKEMIQHITNDYGASSVIVHLETVGKKIQDMDYGFISPYSFVFDISVNGEYLDWPIVVRYCGMYDVELVPELYMGKFNKEELDEHTDGPTMVCGPSDISCSYTGREGLVFKPIKERTSDLLPGSGRAILKNISVEYLSRGKGATDNA